MANTTDNACTRPKAKLRNIVDCLCTLTLLLQDINGFQPDAAWHVGADEVMALMGAHAIMMTLGCTTTADTGENSTVPDLGDRTCRGAGGRQRMFTWDNSFFQVRLLLTHISGVVFFVHCSVFEDMVMMLFRYSRPCIETETLT